MAAKPASPRIEPIKWSECVPWLVGFANLDLETVSSRPGDLPNLLFEIRRYLAEEGISDEVDDELRKADKDPAILKPAHEVVRELVGTVADRKRIKCDYDKGVVELDAVGLDATRTKNQRPSYFYVQSVRDAMLMVAVADLSQAEASRVRRCEETDCRKMFFAGRLGQRYCSHACANAIAARKYRETHQALRAEREKKRYDRKKKVAGT